MNGRGNAGLSKLWCIFVVVEDLGFWVESGVVKL